MSRINKILIIFLMLVSALVFGLWRALQSPYFAGLIANHINERIVSKVDAEVKIGNIEFSILPPATHLNNVLIKKKNLLEIYQKRMSLTFSIWDFLRSELRISEFEIENGYVDIKKLPKGEKSKKQINVFNLIKKEVLGKLPIAVGELAFKNVDIILDKKIYGIDYFRLRPYKYSIDLELGVKSLKYGEYDIDGGEFKFEILKDKIRIIESEIQKNKTKIKLSGAFDNVKDSKIDINYKGRIEEFLPLSVQENLALSGDCECNISFRGNIYRNPKIKIDAKLSDVESSYVVFEEADLIINATEKSIILSKAIIRTNKGKGQILKPVEFNTKKETDITISAQMENLLLHDILYFLGPNFKIMNGRVTGHANINVQGANINVDVKDGTNISEFTLGQSDNILAPSEVLVSGMSFNMSDKLHLKGNIEVESEKLSYEGIISDSGIDIDLDSDKFELQNLGGEIGKILSGSGSIDAKFIGPFEDVLLNLTSQEIKNLKVFNYSIPGRSKADVSMNLSKLKLMINEVQTLDKNKLAASGEIDFISNQIKLGLNIDRVFFGALPESIAPIWNETKPFLKDFEGEIGGSLNIDGSFDSLRVQSSLSSNKVSIYKEPFSKFNAAFYVDNDGLFIDRVVGRKGKAHFDMSLDYLFKEGLKLGKFNIYGLKLNDLNIYRQLGLGYDGTLNIRSKFANSNGRKANVNISMLKSSVGRKKLKPSNINISIDKDKLSLSSSLLGGKANVNGKVFIGNKKNELSEITSSINVPDLKTILGIVSLHNIYDTDLSGEFAGNFSSSFRVGNLNEIDFNLVTKKFRLQKLNKFLALTSQGEINVRKSKINKMSVSVRGTGGSYALNGKGDFNEGVKLDQSFNVDLAFAQLISPYIERAEGRLYGRGILSGKIGDLKNYHELNTEDLNLKLMKVPVHFSNGQINSVLNNETWTLKSMKLGVGSGTLQGNGSIKFKLPFPEMNLKYKLDNLRYPVADKSTIDLSGITTLEGRGFPYKLTGNILINGGRFEDEFNEFKSDSSFLKSVDKYIDVKKTGLPEIIALDLKARTLDTIRVKNRLADLFVNADLKVDGNPLSPNVKGQLNVLPTLSKFKFKGNEFLINDGSITLEGINSSTPFVMNFTSEAKVAQYDVKMSILGSENDLQINMESNPPLSQEDIFSLLALGVTSDFSKNLEEKDKASLTTIGIGTLIVDQLKINEGLDSTLGLKLSVLPEVSESDDSPILASQSDQSSKVKTATKLKIQKKVTKDVDLTFSNTFGGDSGEKQEMNIDFNLNDEFSIQGVFERENDPNENADESSVGADIKYKWSW
ncbi:MAG: hypothetical protein BM556_09675 [Bacteriovorax sp. MedPE-SWde]|nr:MAG: hypothetical protein BM556_09675 [Bacteriovorax sp. MedPE-SWde]